VLSLVPDGQGLYTAASLLRSGGLVAIPTETVYGLAACAFDADAIVKIFDAKDRPRFDPLIVHLPVGPPDQALRGVVLTRPLARRAAERLSALTSRFWPGPLTLVLPRDPAVDDLVTSGRDTVAIRMPAHPVARALLAALGGPVVAPSANRFGSISPTSADHVRAELEGRIDAVLDGGPCPIGVESTVLAVDPDATLRLLRPGAVPVEAIEEVAPVQRVSATKGVPEGPGQLSRHYAPGTPLQLVDDLEAPPPLEPVRVGLLRVTGDVAPARTAFETHGHQVIEALALSTAGDLAEAAKALFAALRHLDDSEADVLVAERPASTAGLGHAIADRLQRASARR